MDRYTRLSYLSSLKSQFVLILIFSFLILESCNQRFVSVKPADTSASLKNPAITTSSSVWNQLSGAVTKFDMIGCTPVRFGAERKNR